MGGGRAEHCFDRVEYISLLTYLNNYADDTPAFLASADLMDAFIDDVVRIADAVAARSGSKRRIMLSFDEWNVWYRTRRRPEDREGGVAGGAADLEEVYTMQDALAFGGASIALLNHADRVRAACRVQLVNAIAPIMTAIGGPAWRQTILHPCAHMNNLGRGRVLRVEIDAPIYGTSHYDPRGAEENRFALPAVPYLKLAAVHDDRAGSLTLLALNRSLDEELPLEVTARGFSGFAVAQAQGLHDRDLNAANTKDEPLRVKPSPLAGAVVEGDRLRATLAPASGMSSDSPPPDDRPPRRVEPPAGVPRRAPLRAPRRHRVGPGRQRSDRQSRRETRLLAGTAARGAAPALDTAGSLRLEWGLAGGRARGCGPPRSEPLTLDDHRNSIQSSGPLNRLTSATSSFNRPAICSQMVGVTEGAEVTLAKVILTYALLSVVVDLAGQPACATAIRDCRHQETGQPPTLRSPGHGGGQSCSIGKCSRFAELAGPPGAAAPA